MNLIDFKATTQKDRIKYLKSIKAFAQKFLLENKEVNNKPLPKWQKEVVNNNIKQLEKCIREIKTELHPTAIEKFIFEEKVYREGIDHADFQLPLSFLPNLWRINTMWIEIAKYSYRYSIINDLYWFNDGTVKDHFEVVLGIKNEEIFEKYCDEYVEFISSTIIPYFKNLEQYSKVVSLLVDLVQNFNSISFLSSNILMYSIIENIVRTFCTEIICLQNPELTLEEAQNKIKSYMSLESLINNGEWKNVRPIEFGKALILNNYISDDVLKNAAKIHEEQNEYQKQMHNYQIELLNFLENSANFDPEIRKEKSLKIIRKMLLLTKKMVDRKSLKVYVSLKVDLQFLVRRYKDNRNSIVHGDFQPINYKWYCYVNLSSIKKLFNIIVDYQKLVSSSVKT